MRGFTRRADTIAPASLIELLNLFYDNLVPAIETEGGEVLKFMGDGLLAIFRIAEARTRTRPAPGRSARRRRRRRTSRRSRAPAQPMALSRSASDSRCTSVTRSTAILARARASTSPASVLPSIAPRGWRKSPPGLAESSSPQRLSRAICRRNSSRWATSNSPDFANLRPFSGCATKVDHGARICASTSKR